MKNKKRIRICLVLGTRPEIIKMAPLIRYCAKKRLDYFVINTGQHYDYLMSKVFFRQLGLPKPKYNCAGRSGTHAEETGRMMIFIEGVLLKEKPDVVVVEGDTNTVLSGVLAAAKLTIPVAHVEAGLRSFDRRMPEEINRILADHAADYLFAPTPESAENLMREGIPRRNIFVVGNTIVDALLQNMKMVQRPSFIERRCGVRIVKNAYMFVTAHRPENVDLQKILKDILRGLGFVHKKYGLPIIYSVHPRTKKTLKRIGLSSILARICAKRGIHVVDPVSYHHQIWLLENARLVITDSGGIQEECCVLRVPCVTVRMNTERPETVRVGGNIIAGTDPRRISACVDIMMKRKRRWANPLGDGKSAGRIITTLLRRTRSKEQAS